jgi:Ca2+-binding RTX toxin-like protein
MHLVHAKGIEEALPEYHAAIERAEKRAVEAGIYKYGRTAPHEYIISGFDIYFGLWDHDPQGNGGSYGDEYPYHTRAEMQAGDRPLFDLVEEFWPEYLTYNAYLDPSFEGTFVMVQDKAVEYTNKSRFLVDVTLTGDKDTSVSGNDQDNLLTGNVGDNGFTGGAGDDVIAGAAGSDRAFFAGVASDYRIETKGAITTITDTVDGRDGTDELTGIEVLVFHDKEVELE